MKSDIKKAYMSTYRKLKKEKTHLMSTFIDKYKYFNNISTISSLKYL